MKRGEFDVHLYLSVVEASTTRHIEAERDWIESWESSIPERYVTQVGSSRPPCVLNCSYSATDHRLETKCVI